MNSPLKTLFLRLSTLLLAIWATSAIAADGAFEERLSIDGPIVLDVSTGSGRIEISPGPGNEAFIRGEIHVNRQGLFSGRRGNKDEIVQAVMENPPIELSDGLLRIGRFEDRSLDKRVSISYEIMIPANTETIASSGSGSISVVNIAAPVEVSAGSGSIKLENIGGAVDASTGSGTIRADGVAGAFDGSTGSGKITMSQTAPGDVKVSTGSGGSELTNVVGAVRASTGSGRITVEGRMEGDWDLDSGSGGIRVTLPEDAAFDIEAESNSGGLDIEHPLTVQGRISERRITGSIRGGGPLLKIDTGSGGVRVN